MSRGAGQLSATAPGQRARTPRAGRLRGLRRAGLAWLLSAAAWTSLAQAQATLGAPAAAPSEACPESSAPHVDGELALAAEAEGIAPALSSHLRAALAARDIVFCLRPARPTSSASLHIEVTSGPGAARAVIEVRDALTQKRVSRELVLGRLPRDGWALALAASSDELLRASWAELVMADAPPPAPSAPPAVVRTATASVRPVVVRRVELEPALSAYWFRFRSAFGAKLRMAYWLRPQWGLLASAGASWGLREDSSHGWVRADTQDLELGAAFALPASTARLGASFELAGVVSRIAFAAHANAAGEADSFADWSLAALGRVRGFFGAGPWRLAAALGAVYTLRPSAARDEGKTVTSNRGLGGEATLGVGAFF